MGQLQQFLKGLEMGMSLTHTGVEGKVDTPVNFPLPKFFSHQAYNLMVFLFLFYFLHSCHFLLASWLLILLFDKIDLKKNQKPIIGPLDAYKMCIKILSLLLFPSCSASLISPQRIHAGTGFYFHLFLTF